MDSPNRMQNRNSGRNDSRCPAVSKLRSPPRWPSWNTNTRTPYTASTDAVVMSTAFSGSSSDRKNTISTMNESNMTRATTGTRALPTAWSMSVLRPGSPPTNAVMPGGADRATRSRISSTSAFDSPDWAPCLFTTSIRVSVPPLVANGGTETLMLVVNKHGAQSGESNALVDDIRDLVARSAPPGITAFVGGDPGLNTDIDHAVGSALVPVVALVMLLSFIVLMVFFRSLLLPEEHHQHDE